MIAEFGGPGIFVLMVLENVFPPIPSELIMALAGYRSAQGDMGMVTIVAWAVAGTVVGNVPWYVLGMILGPKRIRQLATRYGRLFVLHRRDIDRLINWFEHRGWIAVMVGRCLPGFRTLISIPAGIARIPFWLFLVATAAGSAIWLSALAGFGYLLGQNYALVDDYIGPASNLFLLAMVLIWLYGVVTWREDVSDKD